MAYCVIDDIKKQVSVDELVSLTDDESLGTINTVHVNRAIDDADAEIDAAIGTRYPLPLDEIPTIIRRISVDLAIYALFSRRSMGGMPEVRADRRDAAAKLLYQLATGSMTLDITIVAPSEGGWAVVSNTPRIFGDETMEKY
jgi:phage gp36-like protein